MLRVAVGVIGNDAGEVLIALRHAHLHQGGLWEFPGGKVAAGESVAVALARELHEELGIRVERAEPLLTTRHAYADREVELHVWRVITFGGEAFGREGQPLRWIAVDDLDAAAFPAANRPIIDALRQASAMAKRALSSQPID